MHFPLFQISPPIFEKISDFLENFTNFTFSRKNFPFSSAKILVIDHKLFWISPYFACFSTFPPDSRKFIISPYFSKFPPCFPKIPQFFYILYVYLPPPTLTMMHLCITQCTYWTPLLLHKLYLTIPDLITWSDAQCTSYVLRSTSVLRGLIRETLAIMSFERLSIMRRASCRVR